MALLKHLRTAALLAALWLGPLAGAAPVPTEYQVKAVFLFNFTQFVEWPAGAFDDASSPLSICVLGQDPFGAELDEIVRGESVNGRPLAVRRYRSVEDGINGCHVLFIERSQRPRIGNILARLAGRSVLTVGDFEGFSREGGVVRFARADNRIRLHVNLEAAKAAHLTISSKLLRPAHIVAPGED
jgi:hypothetical protein